MPINEASVLHVRLTTCQSSFTVITGKLLNDANRVNLGCTAALKVNCVFVQQKSIHC